MGKGVVSKSIMKTEDRILCVAACACYFFALAACGIAAYALARLSLATCGNLGQGFHMTAALL
jgi:hypothetical protein